MRHAGATAGAVGPLVIVVIEAPFGALLMTASGGPKNAGAACFPTRQATVGVAPIAGATEDEGLPAPLAARRRRISMASWARRWPVGGGHVRRSVATTRASRPRLPWSGCARGPGDSSSGPSPIPLRGRGTLLENWLVCHAVFGWGFRFIQV